MEKNRFAALCAAAGVPCALRKYYEGQPPSLGLHFRVLEDFQAAAGGAGSGGGGAAKAGG